MSAARHLPALLLAAGGTLVVAALAWWGLTYWPPVSNDYLSLTEAARCLVADSSLCRLATSLCGVRHAVLVAGYSPVALWCGAAAGFCGLWVPAARRPVEGVGHIGRDQRAVEGLMPPAQPVTDVNWDGT